MKIRMKHNLGVELSPAIANYATKIRKITCGVPVVDIKNEVQAIQMLCRSDPHPNIVTILRHNS
jgi:hypothetical protein